jgi:hypothetical protein
MSDTEIKRANHTTFKSWDLSNVFTEVAYKEVTRDTWTKTVFNRYFPDKSYNPPKQNTTQNFTHLTYFNNWILLMNRADDATFKEARGAIFKQFNSLRWIPYGGSDRMWITKPMNAKGWVHLPDLDKIGAAPQLAVNPRFANEGPFTLIPGRLRGAVPEEEEESSDEEGLNGTGNSEGEEDDV